ncbi:hypothetical protein ACJIZ3_002059 [Penstemon smallii]|uniref:NAC domain-containing protein n=1 Tax=Penstemon smallii TaxID=265156 RepID=A0ABD3U5G6_9LAMI
MLPGFRFHPTDEELVGFYLKKKLQQWSLPIELIKQVDIYKYDPWDLPKLASTGEKEWYFYCPRDRKYRNSTRPNRVTSSGFWKATGTDRPIYNNSSGGNKCIGLKKSLVFYRGRAAKGMKTDWMMHEFRLPSAPDVAPSPKKFSDKNLPPTDSWAICRIFKKTNSMAHRAATLSHSWAVNSLSETTITPPDAYNYGANQTQLDSLLQNPHDFTTYKNITEITSTKPSLYGDYSPGNYVYSPPEEASKSTIDLTSMLFNISPRDFICGDASKASYFEGQKQQFNSMSTEENGEEGLRKNVESATNIQNPWESIRSMGFPFSLPWDSPPCPSDISSSTYSTDKCYS